MKIIEVIQKGDKYLIVIQITDDVKITKEVNSNELLNIYNEFDKIVRTLNG